MATVVFRQPAFENFKNSPSGDIGRYLHRKGLMVTAAAQRQVGVKTGALRASIHMRHFRDTRGQYIRIGSSLPYARLHHEGTRPHIIKPNNQQVLRFVSRGQVVFAHSVNHPGTRPNKYLSDNLRLIK